MKKSENSIAIVKNVNELPTLLPDMDRKELFNMTQESEPLAQLADKKFKILGIMPEIVEVPNTVQGDDLPFTEEAELVERLRVTIITDIGVFHSFSITFNKALAKAINVFGEAYTENTYIVKAKLRGSGASAKAYYVVTVV